MDAVISSWAGTKLGSEVMKACNSFCQRLCMLEPSASSVDRESAGSHCEDEGPCGTPFEDNSNEAALTQ
jgi:hypothetical protein